MRRVKPAISAGASAASISRKSFPQALAFTKGMVRGPKFMENSRSLPLHQTQPKDRTKDERCLQSPQQLLLFAKAAFDVKLHADVASGAGGFHILHHAVIALENAIHFNANFLDGASRHLVAGKQQL